MSAMETLEEEVEEYNWREVLLPSLIPVVPEPELERETGERRRGRDILVAIDHGPNSRHALHWALVHLCRLADTLHFIHAVSSVQNEVVYESSKQLMETLAIEAFQIAMVRSTARIVEGDAGKAICSEAERLKPAAVVMGTRGRSLIQSVLQGSVSEYCFHNCKAAPVIIVPGKERHILWRGSIHAPIQRELPLADGQLGFRCSAAVQESYHPSAFAAPSIRVDGRGRLSMLLCNK